MSAAHRPAASESRCGRRLAGPIACSLLALAACAAVEVDPPRRPAPSYRSLVRLAERQAPPERPGARPAEPTTETIGGDSRTAFPLAAGQRLELGPIETEGGCRLRFGLGLAGPETAGGGSATLELAVRHGGTETRLAPDPARPLSAGTGAWSDREVGIPAPPDGSWSLVAGVAGGTPGEVAPALLWGSPYLVCDRAAADPRAAPRASPRVSPPGRARRPDVVLISIDTLRADHLGLYGYRHDTSPALDRFAAAGLVFENSFAPAPYTLPSHATMLTGLSPGRHRAGHDHQNHPVDPGVPTVAGLLRDAGYRTIAFTGGGLISKSSGLDRGFDEWTERWTLRRRANLGSVLPEVYDALDDDGEAPLFLFLHTFDVHGPYQQPEPDRYFRGGSYPLAVAPADWRLITAAPHHGYHHLERFSGLADVVAAYDSGIRLVDRRLGQLFAHLERSGRFEGALIIVTSDHGESLFEHRRYISHGHTLHDVELRTPLIVKPPGEFRPARSRRTVGLIDVVPTILEVAGLPAPPGVEGRSLVGPQPAAAERPMLGESGITGARFVRTPEWKVITPTGEFWNRRRFELFGAAAERFETGWQVYRLIDDPHETENLVADAGRGSPELRELVALLRATDPPGRLADNDVEFDQAMVESLRSLGYLQ